MCANCCKPTIIIPDLVTLMVDAEHYWLKEFEDICISQSGGSPIIAWLNDEQSYMGTIRNFTLQALSGGRAALSG